MRSPRAGGGGHGACILVQPLCLPLQLQAPTKVSVPSMLSSVPDQLFGKPTLQGDLWLQPGRKSGLLRRREWGWEEVWVAGGPMGTPQSWPLTQRSQDALCAHRLVQLWRGWGGASRKGWGTHPPQLLLLHPFTHHTTRQQLVWVWKSACSLLPRCSLVSQRGCEPPVLSFLSCTGVNTQGLFRNTVSVESNRSRKWFHARTAGGTAHQDHQTQ